MANSEALDSFGEKLMTAVRDESLDYFEALVAGSMKAPDDIKITEAIKLLDSEKMEVVRRLVTALVDNTLHNTLTMFESDSSVRLIMRDSSDLEVDLATVSDGLAGELYSDEGWIVRFSSYPSSMD